MIRPSLGIALILSSFTIVACSQEPEAVEGTASTAQGREAAPGDPHAGLAEDAPVLEQEAVTTSPILAGTIAFSGELSGASVGIVMVMATNEAQVMMLRRFDLAPESGAYGPGLVDGSLAFRLGASDGFDPSADYASGSYNLRFVYSQDMDASSKADNATIDHVAAPGDLGIAITFEGPLGSGAPVAGHGDAPEGKVMPAGHGGIRTHEPDSPSDD